MYQKIFQQKVFSIYRNIQDLFLKIVNGKDTDLIPIKLKIQLQQFSLFRKSQCFKVIERVIKMLKKKKF